MQQQNQPLSNLLEVGVRIALLSLQLAHSFLSATRSHSTHPSVLLGSAHGNSLGDLKDQTNDANVSRRSCFLLPTFLAVFLPFVFPSSYLSTPLSPPLPASSRRARKCEGVKPFSLPVQYLRYLPHILLSRNRTSITAPRHFAPYFLCSPRSHALTKGSQILLLLLLLFLLLMSSH